MTKGRRSLLIGGPIILLILLTVFAFSVALADDPPSGGQDVTSVLTGKTSVVSQNGTTIPDGGTIDSQKPISVKVSFGVPVEGDEPTPDNPVKKGDWAEFQLSNAFNLVGDTSISLKAGDEEVGIVTFSTDSGTGMVTAKVQFTGDIFDDPEVFDVNCWFSAELKYDATGDAGEVGDHDVTIVDKTYTVVVPPAEIVHTLNKSGSVDLAAREVTWTVKITATQGSNALDLDGYKFIDNLSAVGAYKSGSFTVNSTAATPDYSEGALSYVFPANSISEQTITFKTHIEDANYYATASQTIPNTGRLVDSEDVDVVSHRVSVTFTPPTWIEKNGSVQQSDPDDPYVPENRTITWTVEVNHAGASLSNVRITDTLPAGLTWKSATWATWQGSGYGSETAITPSAEGVYNIGNISTKIRLTIVAEVPDEDWAAGIRDYTNTASVTWEGLPHSPGSFSDKATVGVGFTGISKTSTNLDKAAREVTWQVTVNQRGQTIPNLTVYDLIVYGKSGSFNINTVTGIPDGINRSSLAPRYGQMIVADSATSASPLTYVVHEIYQEGVRVADLLEVKGFTGVETSFTFKTKVIDPDIFAGSRAATVFNAAGLWGGESTPARLDLADASVEYRTDLLDKDMLVRGSTPNTVGGANNRTTTLGQGFDYVDKSVVFRLSVNASGLDLTGLGMGSGDTPLGNTIVTDTLPEDWEFVEIVPGAMYQIFEGEPWSSTGSVVRATSGPVTVADLNATFVGRMATFTFSTLDKPYVILVKAKPTEAKLGEYFSKNGTSTESNTVSLRTQNWTPDPGISSSQSVTIVSEILNKSQELLEAGVVRWTVEYRPYLLAQVGGARVEDVLPLGLDVRTDSSGVLDLSDDNITVHEMILQTDGEYTLGSKLEDLAAAGVNPSYNGESRKLTLLIPDPTKAYRFTYITDVTGEPGSVANQVALVGEGVVQGDIQIPYEITEADGSASLQRNGWIEITKLVGSADGAPLSGVRFTVLALDGETIVRTGFTDSDGKLRLKVIPDGTYILRETTPAGYSPEKVDRTLTVTTVGGTVNVTLDGKPGNYHTVLNYLEGTVGDLTISKVVAGNGADPSKQFEFTVTFVFPEGFDGDPNSSFTYYGTGVANGSIASGGTIALAHGQSIDIVGLPKGTTYMVTERDYTSDNYSTTVTGGTGTIVADETQVAAFTNTRNEGDLTIVKTVGGNAGDTIQKFIFTVTFTGDPNAVYSYVGNGVPDGTLKSGGTIALAHGQSITFVHLPESLGYTVTESDYSSYGYVTTSKGGTGTVVAKTTQTAAFTNTRNVYPPTPENKNGDLTITKTVTGTAGSRTKQFIFTVTFDAAPDTAFRYIGEGVAGGTIKSGGTIALAHGQSITIVGLPEGTRYTVSEDDYSQDGYVTSSSGASGTIVARTTQTASFTNAHKVTPPEPEDKTGDLTITKTVGGNAASIIKQFTFTVAFDGDQNAEYAYTGHGVPNGTLKSGDSITLAHGQSITFKNLPEGLKYTVTEADYSEDGYVTGSTGSAGTIVAEQAQVAAFTNTRNVTPPDPEEHIGNLTITKTVAGSAASTTKQFTFTVAWSGGQGTYPYVGHGVPGGTIRSGDSITLAHGQSITIVGVPVDVTYQVTEDEADQDGYVTTVTGAAGTIVEAGQTAAFVNTKTGQPTEEGGGGITPGDGTGGGTTPKTGDSNSSTIWFIGLGACALLLLILIGLRVGLRGRETK